MDGCRPIEPSNRAADDVCLCLCRPRWLVYNLHGPDKDCRGVRRESRERWVSQE